MNAKTILKLVLFLAFIGGAIYFFRFTETGKKIEPNAIIEQIESFDLFTAGLIYVAIYILGTLFLVPGTALSFAGAVVFGAYLGTLLTWIGATIGATLSFLAAKLLGRDFVTSLFGNKLDGLDRRIRDNGFTGLLIIRLVPAFPYNVVNFGSGFTSIGLRDYVLATAIGILPGTFVYQFLFAKFGRAILKEGFRWELLAALGLFVVFILVGKWASKKLAKKETEPVSSSAGTPTPQE
ncbi:MAG: TVP38/TMEM64 family protein [Gemmataceae bacterium]